MLRSFLPPPKPAPGFLGTPQAPQESRSGILGDPGFLEVHLENISNENYYIGGFLRHMTNAKGSRLNTVEAYGRDLRQLEDYLDIPIEEATKTALMAYVLRLYKNGKHPATISRKIAVFKNFYRYLYYQQIIAEDPAIDLKHPRFARDELGASLTEVDKMKLRAARLGPGMSAKEVRDRAITSLIFSTGIKASDLVQLNMEDYDTPTRCLNYQQDTNSETTLLDYDLAELMEAYKDTYRAQILREAFVRDRNGEPLFLNMKGFRLTRQGVWKIVREYGRTLELSVEISPRILRTCPQ